MKVFISINDLTCGGAQKSLMSFLNNLSIKDGMDIDLLVLDESNKFFDDIPGWIHILKPSNEVKALFMPINGLLKSKLPIATKVKGVIAKILLKKTNRGNTVQRIWKVWRFFISNQTKQYDIAISYVDGFSNYYVVDKVVAHKKILWIHNEYEKLSYKADYDRTYFSQADALVTISEACVDSLNRVFPEYKGKTHLLYNLSSPSMIWKMSEKGKPVEYGERRNILISIGRLDEQKGFDLAIKASKLLHSRRIDFTWFIIGEGELREELLDLIKDAGVEQQVQLLGLRKNPYPYIRYADLFVQPSRYEGKSIVLDEAKILCKPIVVTDYDTVYDSIESGKNGSICHLEENDLASTIFELLNNVEKRKLYSKNLSQENNFGCDIEMYLKLFRAV